MYAHIHKYNILSRHDNTYIYIYIIEQLAVDVVVSCYFMILFVLVASCTELLYVCVYKIAGPCRWGREHTTYTIQHIHYNIHITTYTTYDTTYATQPIH